MTRAPLLLAVVLALAAAPANALEQPIPALPPVTGTVVNVSNVNDLISACNNLQSNTTIVIAAGTYNLGGNHLEIDGGITNVALRGATGSAADVVIDGGGMTNNGSNSAFDIEIDNATNVTIADLSIGNVYFSALQLDSASGCQSILCHDVDFYNTGEQLLKSNPTNDSSGNASNGVNNSTIEYCTFEYKNGAVAPPCPEFGNEVYSNGIDVHHGANWIVRCCQFLNMGGGAGDGLDGPSVLFWNGSTNPLVERCSFLNCQRGIFFGLEQRSGTGFTDCAGGIIRNNMIVINNPYYQDAAIGIWDCPNTQVLHNTCLDNGGYMDAIEYRFTTSTNLVIENNLTDNAILARDGATATVSNNVTNAVSSWFVNAGGGDLHLTATATPAFFAGLFPQPQCTNDWDGNARPQSSAPDDGAHQYNAVSGGTTTTGTTGTTGTSGSSTTTGTSGSGTSASGGTTGVVTTGSGGGSGGGGCGLGGGAMGLLALAWLARRQRAR